MDSLLPLSAPEQGAGGAALRGAPHGTIPSANPDLALPDGPCSTCHSFPSTWRSSIATPAPRSSKSGPSSFGAPRRWTRSAPSCARRRRCPTAIGTLTGLTARDLARGEPLRDVLDRLSTFVGGATIVGQSIGLDLEHLKRSGLDLANPAPRHVRACGAAAAGPEGVRPRLDRPRPRGGRRDPPPRAGRRRACPRRPGGAGRVVESCRWRRLPRWSGWRRRSTGRRS